MLSDYQEKSFKTSRIDWSTPKGRQVAILGVLGEVGSLSTVLKKRIRDGLAYTDALVDATEECGDVIWYLAAIATHYRIDLDKALQGARAHQPVVGANAHLWSAISSILLLNSILAADDEYHAVNSEDLAEPLGETVQLVLNLVEREGISLQTVLTDNLKKTRALFEDVVGPAAVRDGMCPTYEKLPRLLEVEFLERMRGSGPEVLLRVHGLNVGDRLTDNSFDRDGYRFHDALHFGYVAVLGWSPVMRALFRLKRKSDPSRDENDDGARAVIVEEAITQQIFNHARDHDLYRGVTRVDYDLVKWIQKMVRGLEVEDCSAAEWQRAILQGYQAYNSLLTNKGGVLIVDAEDRRLRVNPVR
jgi:NTP pyrophosphatase (non-canonical NTP hydrolase)